MLHCFSRSRDKAGLVSTVSREVEGDTMEVTMQVAGVTATAKFTSK